MLSPCLVSHPASVERLRFNTDMQIPCRSNEPHKTSSATTYSNVRSLWSGHQLTSIIYKMRIKVVRYVLYLSIRHCIDEAFLFLNLYKHASLLIHGIYNKELKNIRVCVREWVRERKKWFPFHFVRSNFSFSAINPHYEKVGELQTVFQLSYTPAIMFLLYYSNWSIR